MAATEPGPAEQRTRHLIRSILRHIAFGAVYLFLLVLMLCEYSQGDMRGLLTWAVLFAGVIGVQTWLWRRREPPA